MNLFLIHLGSAGKMALVGGQAPLAWKREIARREGWLKEWAKVAKWVATWVSLQPTLREGSLYGPSLASLAGEGVIDLVEEKPEEASLTKPVRSRWPVERDFMDSRALPQTTTRYKPYVRGAVDGRTLPEATSRYRPFYSKWRPSEAGQDNDPASAANRMAPLSPLAQTTWTKTSGRRSPNFGDLPPRANRALLEGLSGTTVAAGGSSQAPGKPFFKPQVSRAKAKAPVPPDTAAGKHWLRTVAERSAGAIRSESASIPTREAAGRDGTPLPEPWAAAIAGTPAPQALLARLAGSVTVAGQRDVTGSPPGFTAGSEDTDDVARYENRLSDGNLLKRRPQFDAKKGQPDLAYSGQMGAIRQTSSPVKTGQPLAGGTNDRSEHVPVMPPSAAPALPTLHPPMFYREPTIPLATAMIRRETQQEKEVSGEDDLVELSAKIKRILDEEARRYGIDV